VNFITITYCFCTQIVGPISVGLELVVHSFMYVHLCDLSHSVTCPSTDFPYTIILNSTKKINSFCEARNLTLCVRTFNFFYIKNHRNPFTLLLQSSCTSGFWLREEVAPILMLQKFYSLISGSLHGVTSYSLLLFLNAVVWATDLAFCWWSPTMLWKSYHKTVVLWERKTGHDTTRVSFKTTYQTCSCSTKT
jgi:hypothetical protein